MSKAITRKEWMKLHIYCPMCGSDDNLQTLIGIIEIKGVDYKDTTNKVSCNNCSWEGTPEDLVEEKII